MPCSRVILKIAYDIVENSKLFSAWNHDGYSTNYDYVVKKKIRKPFENVKFWHYVFASLFCQVPPVNLAALTPFLAEAFLTAMATTEAVFDPSSARKST